MNALPGYAIGSLLLVSSLSLLPAAGGAQTADQQFLDDTAAALGGRTRIQAAKTLTLEGQGKDVSFGQGISADEIGVESSIRKVTGYKRVYDLAGGRARFEQTRTPLYVLFSGPVPIKSVDGIDRDLAYDVSRGSAARVWEPQAVQARRVEYYRHPLTVVRAALDGTVKVTNVRTQGGERLADVTLPNGPMVTLAIDQTTKLPARVTWMTDISNLGDIAVETRFGDYRPVDGLQLPTRMTTRQDHKYMTADIRINRQSIDGEVGNLAAPAGLASAKPPARTPAPVNVEEVAKGIWYVTGDTPNNVLVEFRDHLTLVDAPNEERVLAVMAKARELRPNKPLTTLIVTHHHIDHTSGVRAAVSEGIRTIVAHKSIVAYLEEVLRRPHTIVPDALSRKPESRGVKIVPVDDEMVLKEDSMAINMYHLLQSSHATTELLIYFPTARILTDADLYFPDDRRTVNALDPQGHAPSAHNLLLNINFRKLQVERMMPIHGKLEPYSQFLESALTLSSLTSPSQ